jgi:hypothetical protein
LAPATVPNGWSPQVDWATLALDCGYYDQAHLIAEFKEFTGLTPTEFFLSPAVPTPVAAD